MGGDGERGRDGKRGRDGARGRDSKDGREREQEGRRARSCVASQDEGAITTSQPRTKHEGENSMVNTDSRTRREKKENLQTERTLNLQEILGNRTCLNIVLVCFADPTSHVPLERLEDVFLCLKDLGFCVRRVGAVKEIDC